MTGYQALRTSVAVIDLSSRGRLKVSGEDRARLLHAMCTNEIQAMTPGDFCYAFFLTAQGRILADAWVVCLEDHFLLTTEAVARRKLFEHIDKYIIADDVEIEDITDSTAEVAVEGPQAGTGQLKISQTGMPGYRVIMPGEQKASFLSNFKVIATDAEADVVRLEHGRPRYGVDILEKHLVQETRQLQAVSFQKGCYLGQEIVERIRSRGNVHRGLRAISIVSSQPPEAGAEIHAQGQKVGELTSAVFSPLLGHVVALAYLRTDYVNHPPHPMTVGDAAVTLQHFDF